MSVIIMGMDLPENCAECPIVRHSKLTFCPITEMALSKKGRSIACPMSELKAPHGRLVDADAGIESIEKGDNAGGWLAPVTSATKTFAILQIDAMETVIERED